MKKEKKMFPFLFGMPDFMGNAHVLLFIINSTDVSINKMDSMQCASVPTTTQHNRTHYSFKEIKK